MEFGKLDEQSKMNRQGTGLGLTISKNMITQMGGDIKVTSEFGKGTTFCIFLRTKTDVLVKDLLKFEIDKKFNDDIDNISKQNYNEQKENDKSKDSIIIESSNNLVG